MKKKTTGNLNSLSSLFSAPPDTLPAFIKSDGHGSAQLAPGQTLCGNLNIRINSDGLWFYHGSPIGRKELVKLFASVLSRDNEGRYWLTTPAEKGEITVEDAPFQAVEMTVHGQGEHQVLEFRTNIDEIVIANKTHPIRIETDQRTEEPSPYILVRKGLEARLTRAVFYQLVDLGVEKAQKPDNYNGEIDFGIWSSGQFFQIGKVAVQD
jgi:hypothetical protein